MKIVNGYIIKIYNRIMKTRWINKPKKINRRIRGMLFHNICFECEASFGNKNANRKFYLIRCPQDNMGLFAVINYVVWHLKKADELELEPVIDWKYYPNKYFTEDISAGKVNVWDVFFAQPANITVDELYMSKNVHMSSGDWVPDALKEVYDKDALFESHTIYHKYIHLNSETYTILDETISRLGIQNKKILGLKIRGTDFITTKPSDHSKIPTLTDIVSIVKEKMVKWGPFDKVFLSTEDKDALKTMIDIFGNDILYLDSAVFDSKNVGNRWLGELYDEGNCNKIADMRDYLISTYILAELDYLLAPSVGGTVGALRIKGKYSKFEVI